MVQLGTEIQPLSQAIQKTEDWFKELMGLLRTEDPQVALRVLRAVLHALRDRLMVTEAADVAAQLPLVIRGLYYEGWHPAGTPTKERRLQPFLDHIQRELQKGADPDPTFAAECVFRLLENRISAGEISDVKHALSPELRELWPGSSDAP